ncbi:MAG: hypothetical protein Q8M76_16130 [Spirochaetaceae bacterium]|nr:hypothetical protein [Spirochaetaceae bacterium]
MKFGGPQARPSEGRRGEETEADTLETRDLTRRPIVITLMPNVTDIAWMLWP